MLNRIAADIQVFKVMHPTGGLCSNFACFCCCYHNFIRFLCQAVMTFEFWNKNLCFWFQFYCTRLQFFKGMRGNPTASTWDACGVSCASSGRKKCQTQKSMNASTWTACRWMKRQKKEKFVSNDWTKRFEIGVKKIPKIFETSECTYTVSSISGISRFSRAYVSSVWVITNSTHMTLSTGCFACVCIFRENKQMSWRKEAKQKKIENTVLILL